MKKHTATLGLIIALGTFSAFAEPITPEAALSRLNGDSQARRVVGRHKTGAKQMKHIASLPELYVFSSGDGYVILPADDVAQPLLAYADSGEFAVDGNPALQWWLSTYAEQIEAASKSGAKQSQIYRASRQEIKPLTQTHWNQSAPYNDMCPEIGGKRSVTGCVATAMAQVMKYHNYPAQGSGTHSYDWTTGGKTLSFDYGSTTFDWANMLDEYTDEATDEQKAAVATLMSACGISVDMNYTAVESGASSLAIGPSLIEYFGYDQGIWQPQRQYYGLEEWEEMIYSNLAEGMPVLYSGVGSAGGHQFVCDGYSADGFFHFNWGWGGLSDGYFQLTALDPSSLGIGGGAGGFNSNQAVVLGVQPPVEGSKPVMLVYCGGSFASAQQEVQLGEPAYFTGGLYNYSCTALPTGTQFGIAVEPANGGETQYLHMTTLTKAMEPEYGYSKIAAVFPETMENGTYTIRPAFKPTDGEWQTVLAPLGAVGELSADVNNGVVTFAAKDAPSIAISNLQMNSDIYWGSQFALSFTISNTGEEEYYGTLVPVLLSSDGSELIAEANTYPVDIQPGDSSNESYSGTFSASNEPEAGSYLLALMSTETGQAVGQPIEVTLNDEPAQTEIVVNNLTVESQDAKKITFTMDVNCEEGYYAGELTVAVFPNTGGSSVATGKTQTIYIGGGESTQATATVNIGQLAYGDYIAAAYKGSAEVSQIVEFTITDTNTSIDEVAAGDANKTIYDLQGRKVTAPQRGGIYIVGNTLRRL